MLLDGLERYFVSEVGASLAVALIRPASSGHIRGPQEVRVQQESALGPGETLLQPPPGASLYLNVPFREIRIEVNNDAL